MDQNPYESPTEINAEVAQKTIFTPWLRKWGGGICMLLGAAGMIGMMVLKPALGESYPVWTYPIFAIFFIAFYGGIAAAMIQIVKEIMDYFR